MITILATPNSWILYHTKKKNCAMFADLKNMKQKIANPKKHLCYRSKQNVANYNKHRKQTNNVNNNTKEKDKRYKKHVAEK